MNDAQTLGQVFNLPDPIPTQVVRGGSGGSGAPQMNDAYFGIPEAQDGLQATGNVANDTASYYQKLAGVRQFAQGMWQNYKIDVTKPDYSRPEAVAAAEAFKMELANAEATANQAKNSQSALTAAKSRPNTVIRSGAFQPGQYFEEQTPEQQAVDFSQTPATSDTIKNYSGDVENKDIQKNEQDEFDKKIELYTAMADKESDPAVKAKILGQRDQMVQAQNLKLNPTVSSWQNSFGTKIKTGLDDVTRIVNHQKGIFENPESLTASDYFANGRFWLENKDFNGTDIGQIPVPDAKGNIRELRGTIDKTVKDPKTGEVKWIFKEKDIPSMRIDNLPTKTIIGYLGGKINKAAVDEFLAQNPQALDEKKEIKQNLFIANSPKQKSDSLANEISKSTEAQSGVANKEIDDLQALRKEGFWTGVLNGNWLGGGKSKEYTTSDNKQITVTRGGDGNFRVDNIKDLFPGKDVNFYKEYKNLTPEQLPTVLKKLKALPQAPIPDEIEYKGKKYNSDDIKKAAEKSGMTVDEYLEGLNK